MLRNASVLVYSVCMRDWYPEIVEQFSTNRVALWACMEEWHISQVVAKLYNIVTRGGPRELVVLTMDGSPHCLQLHFAAEMLRDRIPVRHYVVEKGAVIEVPPEAVKAARHLHRVQHLLQHGK